MRGRVGCKGLGFVSHDKELDSVLCTDGILLENFRDVWFNLCF